MIATIIATAILLQAPTLAPLPLQRSVVRTMSVFGNDDGEIGRPFADGDTYRRGSDAWAFNEVPLGTIVTVTTPDGTTHTAKVKDRTAKRFRGKRIDATLAAWHASTSRGYGLIRGCRVSW